MDAWNTLDAASAEIIDNCRLAIAALCDHNTLEESIKRKHDEVEVLTELTKRHINENSRTQCDQEAYLKRYNELFEKYHDLSAGLAVLEQQHTERKLQSARLTAFDDTMEQNRQTLGAFSESLWSAVVEKATVYADGKIKFTLMDSTIIEA